MKCRSVQRRANQVDGVQSLSASDQAHVAACDRCETVLRRDATVVRLLREKRAPDPDSGFEDRLISKLRDAIRMKEAPAPALGWSGAGRKPWYLPAAAAAVLLVGIGLHVYRRPGLAPADHPASPALVGSEPAPSLRPLSVSDPVTSGPGLAGLQEGGHDDFDRMAVFPAMAPTNTPPESVEVRTPRPHLIRYDP